MEAASRTRAAGIAERAAGEPGALLGELYREHGRTVYGLCLVLLRNSHEAEDAAQQAFVSAYESLRGGVTPDRPNAWLLTIARNECLDRLRRRARRAEAPLDRELPTAGVEEVAARNATIDELRAALSELPASQRDAIVLHELGGLGYTQVAQALDVSVAAVESLLFRARQRLRERADTLRVLGGLLILPVGLREGLAEAIPGFPAAHSSEVVGGAQAGVSGATGGAGGSAGGGVAGGSLTMSGGTLGTLSVKLASLPLLAKVAASVAVIAGAASAVAHEVGSTPAARTMSAFETAAQVSGQSTEGFVQEGPPEVVPTLPGARSEGNSTEGPTPTGPGAGGPPRSSTEDVRVVRPGKGAGADGSPDAPIVGIPFETGLNPTGDPPPEESPTSAPAGGDEASGGEAPGGSYQPPEIVPSDSGGKEEPQGGGGSDGGSGPPEGEGGGDGSTGESGGEGPAEPPAGDGGDTGVPDPPPPDEGPPAGEGDGNGNGGGGGEPGDIGDGGDQGDSGDTGGQGNPGEGGDQGGDAPAHDSIPVDDGDDGTAGDRQGDDEDQNGNDDGQGQGC